MLNWSASPETKAWTRSPSISPLGVGLDLIPLNFPLGYGPGPDPPELPPWVWAWPDPPNFPQRCEPRPDSPQFPPWVWAWTRSPSTSPLDVGLDLIPLNFPLGCGPGDLVGGVPAWSQKGDLPGPRGCLVPGVPTWSQGGGIPVCTDTDSPSCEQNHRRLWKCNLAPTSLRAVFILLVNSVAFLLPP